MKRISIALAFAGVAITTLLIGWFGFAHVADAVVSIGWDGFALLLGVQILLFALLGVPWSVIAGGAEAGGVRAGSLATYVWARAVRDSGTNCLPFSSLGGFVFGTRVLTLHGVAWPLATASTIVDVTAEVLAQMLFALLGLCLLLSRDPGSPVAVPLAIGVGVGIVALAGFVWTQQGASAIFGKLGRRIAGHWFEDAADRVAILQGVLSQIYGRTARLTVGTALHLAGWVATAFGAWLTYQLVGADLDFEDAIMIEALLRALLAATFVVPGNAGVQEAGYAGLGLLFGVPAELSLSVSLISRARDLALGVPVLLAWQWLEARRLRPARRTG